IQGIHRVGHVACEDAQRSTGKGKTIPAARTFQWRGLSERLAQRFRQLGSPPFLHTFADSFNIRSIVQGSLASPAATGGVILSVVCGRTKLYHAMKSANISS